MPREEHTVRGMLRRTAIYFPANDAVVDEQFRYTYRELYDRVRRTARLYHDLGVRKGDRVALLLLPSANHVVALFAAYELGAIPVALHVRESVPVLVKTLQRLSPRILVYEAKLAEQAGQLRAQSPGLSGFVAARSGVTPLEAARATGDPVLPDDLHHYDADLEPMAVFEDDIALICLSSGTTGIPKGVIHRNRPLVEGARGGVYIYGVTPHSAQLIPISTSFMGWQNGALPVLNVGGKLVFMAQFSPKGYVDTLRRERCTIAVLLPTIWRMLFQMPVTAQDFDSVELAGFAGEVIDIGTLNRIRELVTPNIINIYGTTESGLSGGTMMFRKDLDRPDKITSIGKPLLNSEVRVIAPGGTADDILPPGEEGEIIIRGPSVANEMWDDPAKTRQVFEGPWWHSGDLGVMDDEQFLYIRGRLDDMIISGGINIMPAPVEDAILKHPAVAEVAVVGLPDDVWGQAVTAFVMAKAPVTAEELDAFLQASDLSSYQRPRRYEFLDELPKGPTGKLNRRALRTRAT